MTDTKPTPTKRGTSNGNERGSSYTRRSRRAWMMATYAADIPGYVRCYRHGGLLYNPDDHPDAPTTGFTHIIRSEYGIVMRVELVLPLTIDRIIPGCQGGTYRRTNIRPACGACNSETGGALSRHNGKKAAK